jgi:bifunctional DNase/RNase
VNELTVVGVRVELPSNQPIVLLKEAAGDRYLPIWIGAVEATAIAFAQQGVVPARPLTHDLLKDVLEALQAEVTVSARPSDAIALAIRAGTPIYAEEPVLAEAGVAIPDEQENEVEKFREFLDQVSPEDFETGS